MDIFAKTGFRIKEYGILPCIAVLGLDSWKLIDCTSNSRAKASKGLQVKSVADPYIYNLPCGQRYAK